MTERNLLLIGRTGGGKSSLANALIDKIVFSESSGTVSETKNFQSEAFEWKGTKYRVFDTIGIGDTSKLSEGMVLYRIAEGINALNGGINQILFVVGDRFTKEEEEAFRMIRFVLDASRILFYTTLVRTKFSRFDDSDKCREDRDSFCKENEEMFINFKKIIYVNNPTMDTDDEDEISISKKKRKKSKEILLNYLRDECQAIYKLRCWDILKLKFSSYLGRELEFEERKKKFGDKDSKILNSELESAKIEYENAKKELIQEVSLHLEEEIPDLHIRISKDQKDKKGSGCTLL